MLARKGLPMQYQYFIVDKHPTFFATLEDAGNFEYYKKKEWTPLIHACYAKNHEVVNRLCKIPEIDVNTKDRAGNSAAHIAVR